MRWCLALRELGRLPAGWELTRHPWMGLVSRLQADVVIQPGTRLGKDGVQAAPEAERPQLFYHDK